MNNCVCGIKEYAKQAKNRLINGYWENIKIEREKFLEKHNGSDIENLKLMYRRKVEKEIFGAKENNSADEKLYHKVAKLLSENEYVLNPIMRLIDHNKYDSLSYEAKQLYISDLTDKYNEMKERFEKEQKEELAFGG